MPHALPLRLERPLLQAALAALLLLTSGCEGLRPLTWLQGAGDNLHEISEYKGKTFTAQSGLKRFKGQTSRADQLVVLEGFDKVNNLDAVELQFTDGLFADLDLTDFIFYGRENHEYTFRYDFTDDYVVLSKVAAREDIPSQELTYAQDMGNGTFKVPMMGLPIALYTVEVIRDERGKDTRKQTTYPKDYLHEATHFKIRLEGIQYFDAPGKQDLLPVSYFNPDDEWFFTKTLVGRPINSRDILGSQVQALKIKFARTNNSVIGVDLNIAKEQEVLDPTKTITALEFPVEWVDFRLEKTGTQAYLKETKLGDKEPTSRFWMDREYALLDFNNADRLDRAFTLDNKLEKLEIGENYLSFNIYESSTGNTYKYSLAKENRELAGQPFHKDDANLFHIFTEKKKVISGNLFTQDPDIDRIVFANRFYPDPKTNEIVYHLSQNSPDVPEFEEAVRTAIQVWDKAFQDAGTDIRVRFDEKRVELGDVRYNQIVLYGYEIDSLMESGGMLLGFGPSLQDTRTGQTYSAATHIYLRAYREGLISSIRSFVRNELGLYADKKVSSVASFAAADALEILTPPAQHSGSAFALSNLVHFLSDPEVFPETSRRQNYVELVMPSEEAKAGLAEFQKQAPKLVHREGDCDYFNVAARSTSWKNIRQTCLAGDNAFSRYLADLKAAHQADKQILNLPSEEEAILACAQPLMKDLLISTLIHEVGHNLGMGHNFAASSDGANFAKNADGTIAFPSSSVMDYPDRDYDVFSKAGPYDVATIAFLYGRKVETKNGELLPVPEGKSASETARLANVELKRYRMCTDYEALNNNIPDFDPLCTRWDVGTNPKQYVLWATRKIHADIIENGYRYNNVRFGGARAGLNYFLNFKQIHDYFRYLVVKQTGLFFDKMSTLDEATLLQAINQTSNPQLTLSYYEAVKEIFKFSRELLNMPSRLCLAQDATGATVGLVEFKDLRNRIFEKHQKTVQNCKEAEVHGRAILKDLGYAYANDPALQLSDRGVELAGYELDLDPNASAYMAKQTAFNGGYWDLRYSSGVAALKTQALLTLVSRGEDWKSSSGARIPVLRTTEAAGVRGVNFLDFPWFANALYSDAVNRVVSGLEQKYIDPALTGRAPLYREYEDFNYLWLRNMMLGGFDQRSPAYGLTLSLRARKEPSQATFDRAYGTSEEALWYVNNTRFEVVYAGATTMVGRLIRLLTECYQVADVYDVLGHYQAGTAQSRIQARLTATDPKYTGEERLFQASLSYFGSVGMTLQPAQKGMLRQALKSAMATATPEQLQPAGEAAFLAGVLQGYTNTSLLNPMVMDLAVRDFENYTALVNTLNQYLGSL